jgi:acetyl-CoA synthetase
VFVNLLLVLCIHLKPVLFAILKDVVPKYATTCAVEWVDAEDALFLLYTSGSTGKPKVLMFVETAKHLLLFSMVSFLRKFLV